MASEDTQKQFLWSKPIFKDRKEEVNHLYNRYEKYMTEDAVPPEPSREEELQYLSWLEKSFSEDPFITLHPKMYAAGPYRLHYRYRKAMKKEYRKTFFKNFLLSVGLTWPLIIYLANRKRYQQYTGVPATFVRKNIFTPDYKLPDSYYNETIRKKFKWGMFKYGLFFGLIGAYLSTEDAYKDNNDLNMRPDFNQMRILVPQSHIPLKEKKVFETLYGDYFGMKFEEDNSSIWKKLVHYFYPYYNYNPNPRYYEPFYDYKKDYVTEEFKNHYHFNI